MRKSLPAKATSTDRPMAVEVVGTEVVTTEVVTTEVVAAEVVEVVEVVEAAAESESEKRRTIKAEAGVTVAIVRITI